MTDHNLASHIQSDAEIERMWVEEAGRRLAACRNGSMKTVSLEEALAGCERQVKSEEG